MFNLARYAPHLKSLFLTNCNTLTDEGVQIISHNLLHLHTLMLNDCSLNDAHAKILAGGCWNLRNLSLRYPSIVFNIIICE